MVEDSAICRDSRKIRPTPTQGPISCSTKLSAGMTFRFRASMKTSDPLVAALIMEIAATRMTYTPMVIMAIVVNENER